LIYKIFSEAIKEVSARLFAKTYESFLEKIAIGVIGVKSTLDTLQKQGHNPIPMEKGTTSFKIWASFKTKRFRVPDIVCLNCGKRFEVRAKTKPEISMSHSERDPDRAWDYGLTDEDYVVIVSCKRRGTKPIDWECVGPLHFVLVGDLKAAHTKGNTFFTKSKGREEGFERRLIWPAKFAKKLGKVVEVNEEFVKLEVNGRKRKYSLTLKRKQNDEEKSIKMMPLVKSGENVAENQAIASVVDIKHEIPCKKSEANEEIFINLLSSSSRVDRFIGAKALRYFPNSPKAINALKEKLNDSREEKLILYEVAASLLELNQKEGEEFIKETLNSHDPYSIHEIIISLCELTPSKSFKLIKNVLVDETLPEAVRVTAAWGLGELKLKEATKVLIDTFNSISSEIKKEAARALFQITLAQNNEYFKELLDQFKSQNEKVREGLSWVIAKTLENRGNSSSLSDILDLVVDENSKLWVSYILGTQNPSKYEAIKEEIRRKDEKVFFAVNLLWVILRSWIWELKEY